MFAYWASQGGNRILSNNTTIWQNGHTHTLTKLAYTVQCQLCDSLLPNFVMGFAWHRSIQLSCLLNFGPCHTGLRDNAKGYSALQEKPVSKQQSGLCGLEVYVCDSCLIMPALLMTFTYFYGHDHCLCQLFVSLHTAVVSLRYVYTHLLPSKVIISLCLFFTWFFKCKAAVE